MNNKREWRERGNGERETNGEWRECTIDKEREMENA